MTIHIRPTAALAQRALLPDDPGVALALAQALVERPLMFNHHRGLWGYTGVAGDGEALTVQSTGIGGSSAAVVFDELIALGLGRAIRVGACAARAGAGLELGELLIVEAAVAGDGTSGALGADGRIAADAGLTDGLRAAAPGVRHGAVVSLDLFYRPDGGGGRAGGDDPGGSGDPGGARQSLAVELETAALFALGARRGIPVSAVLAVGEFLESGLRLDDDALAAAAGRAGRLGLRGLTRSS